MAIKNATLTALSRALTALDGRPDPIEITEGGQTRTVIHTIPYKLSGRARYAIARCLAHIKPALETFAKAHDGLVRQYSAQPDGSFYHDPFTGDVRVAPDNDAAFQAELTALQDAEADVSLHQFYVEDLNLDENAIPPTILAALEPCFIDPDVDDNQDPSSARKA